MSHRFRFGPFCLDPLRRVLVCGGQRVPLTSKTFETLLVLVRNSGRVVTKEELMRSVWPDTIVEEIGLARNICSLRKSLGDSPSDRNYVATVPGRGYRFVTSVHEEFTNDGAATREGPEESSPTQARAMGVKSIAVLPFKPLGTKVSPEYLGLGMADALIIRLSKLRLITVPPTSAVRAYAYADEDPVVVGTTLKVDSVLEGSIQQTGERIRVTVQLLSVPDGRPLWADKFDGTFIDIFAMQDSISEQVTAALALKLSGEERRRLTRRYTESVEAYRLYLEGQHYWNRRTPEGIGKAISRFQQAIEKDPGYALAYVGLAGCRAVEGYYTDIPPKESFPKAKASLTKALEIDSDLADAHASLGMVHWSFDWDWTKAQREFTHAIELDPNSAVAHHWYGWYFVSLGRFDEGIAEITLAQKLDPLSPIISTNLGRTYYFAGRYDEAIAQAHRTLELDPNFPPAHQVLGMTYAEKREFVKAATELNKAVALSGGDAGDVASLAYVAAKSGRESEARKILAQLVKRSKQRYVPPYYFTRIYAGLGDDDQSFKWLDRAVDERSEWLRLIAVDPALRQLHSDARFAQFLRRVGLRALQ